MSAGPEVKKLKDEAQTQLMQFFKIDMSKSLIMVFWVTLALGN